MLAGRDIFGSAQTGTGKTASFTLPMIDILAAGRAKARMPRSLILEPTRELAAQVADNFDTYGKYHKLNKALIIGGKSMGDQVKVLERGVDVLIATPGRLLDMFDRGYLLMNDVKILVIDEADRMLDMGFIPDVERILSLVSRKRQTLLFSATMPPEIRRLASAFLINPKEIMTSPSSTPAETVAHGLVVIAGEDGLLPKKKRAALRRLINSKDIGNALIFCNRKRDIGILQRSLERNGYDAQMLHGDMAQSARTEVLARFKGGGLPLLVCSDVAARGLDIAGVDAVINFDVPSNPEDYIHRIGRTGRAGRPGRAFTVATPEDGKYVAGIETLIGTPIDRLTLDGVEVGELAEAKRGGRSARGRRSGSGSSVAEPRAPRSASSSARPAPARSQHARPVNGEQARPEAARAAASPPPTRQSKKTTAAPDRERPGRSKRQKSDAGGSDGEAVVGMGNHVPAFLRRVPKLRD